MTSLELKENRKRLKLTQDELAKELGVDRRTIINYEQGEVIPESKVKLLHIIFTGDNGKNTKEEVALIDSIANELLKSKVFIEGLKVIFNEEEEELKKGYSEKHIARLEKILREAKEMKLSK